MKTQQKFGDEKVFQYLKLVMTALTLSILLTQPAHAEDVAQSTAQPASIAQTSETKVFNSFNDATTFSDKNEKIVRPLSGRDFSGYSLLPFGSGKKSYAEALSAADKSGAKILLVAFDGERLFSGSQPPPGSFIGGTYHVTTLRQLSFDDLTPQNLLANMSINGMTNQVFIYAKRPEFKELTAEYKTMVRSGNLENAHLSQQVQLIILHEDSACAEDLLKWAQYHKSPDVRTTSMLGLIKFGKVKEVEEILKTEQNRSVKDNVQKNLL